MNRAIGFSTGALAQGDFRLALDMLAGTGLRAVELSALRDRELRPLVEAIDSLDLSAYSYVSVHAPSGLNRLSEEEAIKLLHELLPKRWPIIAHPDVLGNRDAWEKLGEWLCIENMDKRKATGRTVSELGEVFDQFPQASFCFDIGHACQVDPTMTEAALILREFGDRLKQVHMSEVSSGSRHEAISVTALNSFRKVAHLIGPETPIILETPVAVDRIKAQAHLAESSLRPMSSESDHQTPAHGGGRIKSPKQPSGSVST